MPIVTVSWLRDMFPQRMRRGSARNQCRERAMRVERLENRRLFTGNAPSEVLLQPHEDGSAAAVQEPLESTRRVLGGTNAEFPGYVSDRIEHHAPSRADAPSWAVRLTESLLQESLRRWQDLFGQDVHQWWRPITFTRELWLEAREGVPAPAADFVATDGALLYALRSGLLSIVRGCAEAVPELVAEVDLSASGEPVGMFLVGDRVVVISRSRGSEPWESAVTVVDVADPARAAVVSRLGFDGRVVASRTAAGELRLVLHHEVVPQSLREWLRSQGPMVLPVPADGVVNEALPSGSDGAWGAGVEPVDDSADAGVIRFVCGMSRPWGQRLGRYETAESFADRIHDELLARVIREVAPPRWYHLDGTGAAISTEPLVDLDTLLEDGDGLWDFVLVTAIDVGDMAAGRIRTVGVPCRGDVTVSGDGDELFIFSEPQDWSMSPFTRVTAVSFRQREGHVRGPFVTAHGRFQGRLLNGLAADVTDGFLRVVVEHAGGWGQGTSVLVFERLGRNLVEVGRVEGLAVGEDLHAVEFTDNRVSLVTYRTSDPLFVIDLSDPRAPALLGELKVSGYSEFMQMLGPDLMISLGRDVAEGEGWESFGPLQLSVFDVSDPSAPRLIDRYEFTGGRGASTAVTGDPWIRGDGDPLAFGSYGNERVITIPVTDGSGGQRIEVLAIDAAGMISSIGVIDHAEEVERTIAIGGRLVAVSNSHVTVHDFLSPVTAIAELRFEEIGSEGKVDTAAIPEEMPTDEPIVVMPNDSPGSGGPSPAMALQKDRSPDSPRRSAESAAAVFASFATTSSETDVQVRRSIRGRFVRPPAAANFGLR